jgi:alkylhydroperoxidase/carboxymuconolactone decarboxylase family protein YurZ
MHRYSFLFLSACLVLAISMAFSDLQAEERDPVTTANLAALQEFKATYDYDTAYLRELAEDSPGAYDAFAQAEGMSAYRKALPLEAHYIARIATMLVEDCGPCTQLNLRMAVEAGVERSTLDLLLHSPEKLPEPLRDVRDHARAIVGEGDITPERIERLRAHYGDEGVAEIAVVVLGSRIYPTLKRAMLADQKCILGELKY